jgi:hypothetical protein
VSPARRGGLRNAGARTPCRRAAWVSDRAMRAKRNDVGSDDAIATHHLHHL